jgi:hypothetical protein
LIRDRVISLWQRPSRTTKEEIARGVVCCPACGVDTRVALFKAATKRRGSSPDLVAYEVPGLEGAKTPEASTPKNAPLAANLPAHDAIKAPFASTTETTLEPHHSEASQPSEAIPTQKIRHRLSEQPPSFRPLQSRAKRIARVAVLEVCLPLGSLMFGPGHFGPSPSRAVLGWTDAALVTMEEGA